MAKPEVNDMIEHSEPAFDRVATGKVTELLSSQFIYEVHKVVEKGREKIPVDKKHEYHAKIFEFNPKVLDGGKDKNK